MEKEPTLLPVREPRTDHIMTHILAEGGPVIVVFSDRVHLGGGEFTNVSGRWIAVPERLLGGDWMVRLHRVTQRRQPLDLLRELSRRWMQNGGWAA